MNIGSNWPVTASIIVFLVLLVIIYIKQWRMQNQLDKAQNDVVNNMSESVESLLSVTKSHAERLKRLEDGQAEHTTQA